jgi:peptide deformylase
MAVRKIRLYGDPILRLRSEPVEEIDDGIRDLATGLVDTVDDAEGLGLAAPQIGVSKRVIVVVEPGGNGERKHHVVVNPEIVSACGEDVNEEGCLSIPGVFAKVKRPQSVALKGMDPSGREISIEAKGLMARAFAHEIDHLDGILFTDRISMVKRSLLKRKLNDIRKQSKEMLRSPQ